MLDRRIYTFLTLYDEMNYRKTAERLNMTQPGVTQHIKFLENEFNVKLFEYDGRTLKKTNDAITLKNHLNSIQAQLFALSQDFLKTDNIKLRVGATKTVGEYVVVPQISRFLAKENCVIDLTVDNTKSLLQMLEKAKLDFAIVEGVFDKDKYPHHLFKKERLVGICAKDHLFANASIPLATAFCEHLIVREKGSGTRRLLETAVAERGYSFDSFRRFSSINNFSVICDIVMQNKAITFAYEPIAHTHPGLATFEIEDMQINGEFNFVYCNKNIAKQKINLFLS